MTDVLLIVHISLAIALVSAVLLQRSEGGALGMGGGGGALMSGRGTANFLTRATAVIAGLFMLTSLGLTMLASATNRPASLLEGPPSASEEAPAAPAGPTVPLAN